MSGFTPWVSGFLFSRTIFFWSVYRGVLVLGSWHYLNSECDFVLSYVLCGQKGTFVAWWHCGLRKFCGLRNKPLSHVFSFRINGF